METNQQKTNEVFGESAKVANKWFSDAASSMMEIYNKQLNMAFGFYNNMFNSFMGSANKNSSLIFPNAYGNGNGNGDTRSFFNPYSWMQDESKVLSPLANVYQSMFKQLTEYNKNWFSSIQNNFQLQQNDLILLSDKYQQVLEKDWLAMKNSLGSINEAYNARIDSSLDFNRKLTTELNRLSNILMKNNEEFWNQATKNYQANAQTDKTKKAEKREVVEAVS